MLGLRVSWKVECVSNMRRGGGELRPEDSASDAVTLFAGIGIYEGSGEGEALDGVCVVLAEEVPLGGWCG